MKAKSLLLFSLCPITGFIPAVPHELLRRAVRLPGFADLTLAENFRMTEARDDACLFLGFPTNWAVAMRSALDQVGIDVKQSQAQELVAAFFGAANWHQLTKHQAEMTAADQPIGVTINTAEGKQERFYWTVEEALFAIGGALKAYPEPVVIHDFSLTLNKSKIFFRALTNSEYQSDGSRGLACIESGYNEYWAAEDLAAPGQIKAAQSMVENLLRSDALSAEGLLYNDGGARGVLEGLLEREGLPAGNLVYIGDHAIAVFHVPEPNGGRLQTARARVYRMEEDLPLRISEVAMYKAELDVKQRPDGNLLTIRHDYGSGSEPDIEISFTDMAQVHNLLSLTHAAHLFSLTEPTGIKMEARGDMRREIALADAIRPAFEAGKGVMLVSDSMPQAARKLAVHTAEKLMSKRDTASQPAQAILHADLAESGLIAVTGAAGSGKRQFIKELTGSAEGCGRSLMVVKAVDRDNYVEAIGAFVQQDKAVLVIEEFRTDDDEAIQLLLKTAATRLVIVGLLQGMDRVIQDRVQPDSNTAITYHTLEKPGVPNLVGNLDLRLLKRARTDGTTFFLPGDAQGTQHAVIIGQTRKGKSLLSLLTPEQLLALDAWSQTAPRRDGMIVDLTQWPGWAELSISRAKADAQ